MHEILKELADLVGHELAKRWLQNPNDANSSGKSPEISQQTNLKQVASETKPEAEN